VGFGFGFGKWRSKNSVWFLELLVLGRDQESRMGKKVMWNPGVAWESEESQAGTPGALGVARGVRVGCLPGGVKGFFLEASCRPFRVPLFFRKHTHTLFGLEVVARGWFEW